MGRVLVRIGGGGEVGVVASIGVERGWIVRAVVVEEVREVEAVRAVVADGVVVVERDEDDVLTEGGGEGEKKARIERGDGEGVRERAEDERVIGGEGEETEEGEEAREEE